VDAVEGCAPSQTTLNNLRDFLRAYCNKPEGIEIVRSDVIPKQAARGVSPRALARKYLNGPPDNTNPNHSAPAFMYVLYYDNTLSDAPAKAGTGQTAASKAESARVPTARNPHADLLPYPAIIFINARFSIWGRNDFLLHFSGYPLLPFRARS
jgi:hypothetical protein